MAVSQVAVLSQRLSIFAFALASILVNTACAGRAGEIIEGNSTGRTEAATSTNESWVPELIQVKYRPDPVDIAAPWFQALQNPVSSVVDAAWYDVENLYLVIVLNGVAYHHCSLDSPTWSKFGRAESLGRFYTGVIRNKFDCAESEIPSYP
jgi:hypothetical protein